MGELAVLEEMLQEMKAETRGGEEAQPLMGRERQRGVWGEGGSGALTHPLTEPICLRLVTPKCCRHSRLQAVPSNRTAPRSLV